MIITILTMPQQGLVRLKGDEPFSSGGAHRVITLLRTS